MSPGTTNRASVQSQVSPVPLILASQRSSASSTSQMSRSNSGRSSKRDSVASIFHRSSMKRNSPSGGMTAPSPADLDTMPVYRLYPSQVSSGKQDFTSKSAGNTVFNATTPTSVSAERPTTSQSLRTLYTGARQRLSSTSLAADASPLRTSGVTLVAAHEPSFGDGDHVDDIILDDANDRYSSLASQRSRSRSQPRAYQPKGMVAADPIEFPDQPFSPFMADSVDAPASASAVAESGTTASSLPHARIDFTTPSREDLNAHLRQPSVASVVTSGTRQASRRPTVATRKPSSQSVAGLASASSAPPSPDPHHYHERAERSSAESVVSQETAATSIHTLPTLQTKGPDNTDAQQLEPVVEDDPRSWDLVAPPQEGDEVGEYLMERRADQLMGAEHLHIIFDDPKLLLRFTGFLNSHRPRSIPILIYYLDALKALRAINYANAIAEALEPMRGLDFTEHVAQPTRNSSLEQKADRAFEVLVEEDLPAFVAHTWTQVVSTSIQRRITGTMAPHLRDASEGLAEVFCLTDPSRPDNPIVFASEEFTRTTQYGMSYTIGRNCRFLQGPRTNQNSVRRLAMACVEGKETTEVIVNYRRDGSPFMNLLMIAPLMDSRGTVRYFIGAQVDVSGLLKESADLEGLAKMVAKEQDPEGEASEQAKKDEFQELTEMFNGAELDIVRKYGGRMHKEYIDDSDAESVSGRRRVLLKDPTQDLIDRQRESAQATTNSPMSAVKERLNGKLQGVYQHYLLVRPAPSLRILFTSPSLRVPGILQSPFLNRIGGSSRVRSDLAAALAEGRGVTAKIRWLTKADEEGDGEGRPRWIHCTPLLGHSGAVGVWMIVLVDEEGTRPIEGAGRRFRPAPPVASSIGGKEWTGSQSVSRERRPTTSSAAAFDVESTRSEREFYAPPAPPRKSSHVATQMREGFPARAPSREPHTAASSVATMDFSARARSPDIKDNMSAKHYTYGDGL